MKSAEMKMKKFEMLVRDIDDYLGRTGIFVYVDREVSTVSEDGKETVYKEPISPLEFIIDNDKKNEYLNIIYRNTFKNRGVGIVDLDYCRELGEIEKQNITKFIEEIRKCNECTNTRYNNVKQCNVPNHLLFWLIFIVCVDNDNYNENLNVVSDTAYLLGFDEKKLGDWITAVKGVLSGKKLNEMKYQTEDAKAFFVR